MHILNKIYPLIFTILTVPFFAFTRDIWDGVIISEAAYVNNLEPIKYWLFSSSWHLQYYQIYLFKVLSNATSLSYYYVNYIFIFSSFLLFFFEVKRFCLTNLEMSLKETICSCLVIALFPIWSSTMSSVMTYHLISFVISLTSVRLVFTRNNPSCLIGYILYGCSLGLNSLLVFIPFLAYMYDLKNAEWKKFIVPSKKTWTLLALGLLYYFVDKSLLPASGPFLFYNEVSFNLKYILLHTGRFLTYGIPIAAVFGIVIIYFLFSPRKISFNKLMKLINMQIAALFLLSAASIAAYVLVGKSSWLMAHRDWDIRHALLLSVPISLLAVSIISRLTKILFSHKKHFFLLSIIFIMTFQFVLSLDAYLLKVNRLAFEKKLISIFQRYESKKDVSYLLDIKGMPTQPRYRPYEVKRLYNEVLAQNRLKIGFRQPNIVLFYTKDAYDLLASQNGTEPTVLKLQAAGYEEDFVNLLLNLFIEKSIVFKTD